MNPMLQMFQEFRDRFGPFQAAVRRLEAQENKTFDLIFLHDMAERFGHLWHDPVLVSWLYRTPPERILVVLCSPPCSEFAVQTLSKAGFTLARASDLHGGEAFAAYINSFQIPEIDLFGKTVIRGAWPPLRHLLPARRRARRRASEPHQAVLLRRSQVGSLRQVPDSRRQADRRCPRP